MRKVVFLLVATATLCCGVGIVEAMGPWLEHREVLGISDQQVAQLESIHSALRKDEIRMEADLQIAEVELDELLRAETVDLPKVKAQLEEIAKLQANLKFLHIKAKEDSKQVLNQEQREKLRKLEEREERAHPARDEDLDARMRELEERYRENVKRAVLEMDEKMKRLEHRYREMMERMKSK